MKEIFRGWQGHLCCECKFHLNTLLEYEGQKIVVSTVGNYYYNNQLQIIGCDRKFETMVFEAGDNEWDDIDVEKQLKFFDGYNEEKEAQDGHYKIIEQVKEYMIQPVPSKIEGE